jgi:Holliday junction resolvase
MTNSKQKGKRGERECCKFLNQFGFNYRRSQQYCGANSDSDIEPISAESWADILHEKAHFEVKRYKKISYNDLSSFLKTQATEDAKNKEPIILYKQDRRQWRVHKWMVKDKLIADYDGKEYFSLLAECFKNEDYTII